MTTNELKSYIDRILGNNIRLLLPSYWWKRAFGAVIDKVDEKVEKSELKTINGESVLGDGDLRVGVKSVESVEALEKLDAEVGDIATAVYDGEYQEVLLKNCTASVTPKNDWDNLTRIRKIELKQSSSIASSFGVYFSACTENSYEDVIIVGFDVNEDKLLYMHLIYGKTTLLSLDEVNNILNLKDYRFVFGINSGITYSEQFFNFYTWLTTADAYIKSDSWEKLSKEHIVASESELNALDAPMGTIVKVASGGKIVGSFRNCYQSNEEELSNDATILENIDKFTKIDEIKVSSSPTGPDNSIRISLIDKNTAQGFPTSFKGLNLILNQGEIGGVIVENGRMVGELVFWRSGETIINQEAVDAFNEMLKADDYRFLPNASLDYDVLDNYILNVVNTPIISDAYIKGETWTKLLKEGDVTGGGSTPFRIWDSYDLTPAQKEDNVRAYNALMNKETFDFELLYIDEGEDYYRIEKEVVTGFTCHMDSQKVHINILVAATEDGLMNDTLYLTSDGTFEAETPPL